MRYLCDKVAQDNRQRGYGCPYAKRVYLLYVRGSHHYLEPPAGGPLVTVPIHPGRTLKPKTLKTVLKQAGLTVEELLDLL